MFVFCSYLLIEYKIWDLEHRAIFARVFADGSCVSRFAGQGDDIPAAVRPLLAAGGDERGDN